MQVEKSNNSSNRRHETCLVSSSNGIKYLRDKITCKLSSGGGGGNRKKGVESSVCVTKMVSAKPGRGTATSTLSAKNKTKSGCKSCGQKKLVKSPDLVSPVEVKKAVTKQLNPTTIRGAKAKPQKSSVVEKKKVTNAKRNKCAGRAAGNEIIKKLKKMQDDEKVVKTVQGGDEIKKQQQENRKFFQHLLLGDEKTDLIKPKTEQKPHSKNIDACRIYLKHYKPVSESKFKQIATRSSSLPPKLQQQKSPAIHAATSVDSLDKYNYHCYIKELLTTNRVSSKFRELSRFYRTLARMGELELRTMAVEPRRKHEDSLIDYERWRALKDREKAERELQMVYQRLRVDQKEKGLLFRPKDVEALKWRRELDRGLRVKERSVEDIKGTFER